jgi:hypothetical protein
MDEVLTYSKTQNDSYVYWTPYLTLLSPSGKSGQLCARAFPSKKTWRISLSIGTRITMILCVVYLLRIFKMFHGLMNNPVLFTVATSFGHTLRPKLVAAVNNKYYARMWKFKFPNIVQVLILLLIHFSIIVLSIRRPHRYVNIAVRDSAVIFVGICQRFPLSKRKLAPRSVAAKQCRLIPPVAYYPPNHSTAFQSPPPPALSLQKREKEQRENIWRYDHFHNVMFWFT